MRGKKVFLYHLDTNGKLFKVHIDMENKIKAPDWCIIAIGMLTYDSNVAIPNMIWIKTTIKRIVAFFFISKDKSFNIMQIQKKIQELQY